MTSTLEKLSPWLFTIAIFVIWEAACRLFKVDPFILPPPSAAFEQMWVHRYALTVLLVVVPWLVRRFRSTSS